MSEFPAIPLPWQTEPWQLINAMSASGRLPHALMLAGPAGIGKAEFARALAQRVLCTAPREGVACGDCRACQLNRAGTHPDFAWVEPEEAGKAIKVDQIRELAELLSKTAQQGGYKVAVVTPAEAMNTNSANAILKTLEEPAANTLLILISHTPSAVLPTIRSRCQIRAFSMPNADAVTHWLSQQLAGESVDIERIMREARGAPLAALQLAQGDALAQRDKYMADLTSLSLQHNSAIDVAGRWHGGDNLMLMEWFITQLHQLARYLTNRDALEIASWPADLQQRLARVNPSILHRYLEKVLMSKKQLLSGANPNKQLLWEELLLDWMVVLRAK